jgi:hypothetical protein
VVLDIGSQETQTSRLLRLMSSMFDRSRFLACDVTLEFPGSCSSIVCQAFAGYAEQRRCGFALEGRDLNFLTGWTVPRQ